MEEFYYRNLRDLEERAHYHAYTDLGTFYWELFLNKEVYYSSKFRGFNRRW